MGHWLARKYHRRFARLLRDYVRAPRAGQAKTWVLTGRHDRGYHGTVALRRLVTSRKGRFLWHTPPTNPYLGDVTSGAPVPYESRYADVAFALRDT